MGFAPQQTEGPARKQLTRSTRVDHHHPKVRISRDPTLHPKGTLLPLSLVLVAVMWLIAVPAQCEDPDPWEREAGAQPRAPHGGLFRIPQQQQAPAQSHRRDASSGMRVGGVRFCVAGCLCGVSPENDS